MKKIFNGILKSIATCSLPIIATVMAGILFYACSEDKDQKSKTNLLANLNAFEERLKNGGNNHFYAKLIEYNEESLSNGKNDYDYEGKAILKKHKNIEEFAEAALANPNATYENDLEPYIHEQIADFRVVSLNNLNYEENILLDSFKKNFEPSVELIMEYEDFVAVNYPDQSKVKNFLTIISRIKYILFVTDSDMNNKRTLSGWESCLVQCIGKVFRNFNVVDWLEFGGNPGSGVLWRAASCGWDCRKSGYYGH